jgi:hypothetical protein
LLLALDQFAHADEPKQLAIGESTSSRSPERPRTIRRDGVVSALLREDAVCGKYRDGIRTQKRNQEIARQVLQERSHYLLPLRNSHKNRVA